MPSPNLPSRLVTRLARRVPSAWADLSAYLAAGLVLGLVLILVLALTDRSAAAASAAGVPAAPAITDDVVRLSAREIGASCWAGLGDGTARLEVAFTVSADGSVRDVLARGASPSMRACVQTHVARWQMLPQARPARLELPVQVVRR